MCSSVDLSCCARNIRYTQSCDPLKLPFLGGLVVLFSSSFLSFLGFRSREGALTLVCDGNVLFHPARIFVASPLLQTGVSDFRSSGCRSLHLVLKHSPFFNHMPQTSLSSVHGFGVLMILKDTVFPPSPAPLIGARFPESSITVGDSIVRSFWIRFVTYHLSFQTHLRMCLCSTMH